MSASLPWISWNSPIGAAELAPLAGVGERHLERPVRDPDRLGGEQHPLGVEAGEEDRAAVRLGLPIRASSPTSQSSRISSPVGEPRQPIFENLRPRAKPGESVGIANIAELLLPASPVRA